ncbi:hypothetical protein V8G54_037665 [Vigna mungo]|uniref:Uncharacterized protein n=1 Tax=Vigna mungo TaxID=3915 RepID=A0AAQ3MJK0_VIGMU
MIMPTCVTPCYLIRTNLRSDFSCDHRNAPFPVPLLCSSNLMSSHSSPSHHVPILVAGKGGANQWKLRPLYPAALEERLRRAPSPPPPHTGASFRCSEVPRHHSLDLPFARTLQTAETETM